RGAVVVRALLARPRAAPRWADGSRRVMAARPRARRPARTARPIRGPGHRPAGGAALRLRRRSAARAARAAARAPPLGADRVGDGAGRRPGGGGARLDLGARTAGDAWRAR